MLVLGVETSCDETAAAVVKDGREILSNVVYDQTRLHAQYGGVVPELAGRSHVENIHRVIREALAEADVVGSQLDLVAATQGPGLVCSLLVGINTAKALAFGLNKPLLGVNHLEGHLLAVFLQEPVEFPFLGLIVSGGHTDLYRVDGFGRYRVLGRTRDDAAGECYDKVAKMMGLGYPGGPVIDRLAQTGNPEAFKFPRALLEPGSLDFSFSGLKTSVKNFLEKRSRGTVENISDADVAASFQEAVVDALVVKIMRACQQEDLQRVVVSGGVAANSRLRERVQSAAESNSYQSWFPLLEFCTDNAAMIACAAYFRYKDSETIPFPMDMDAKANLAL